MWLKVVLGILILMGEGALADDVEVTSEDCLNLRSLPSATNPKSNIITCLPPGQNLTVLEQGRYLKVRTPEGRVGYVARNFTKATSTTEPAPTKPQGAAGSIERELSCVVQKASRSRPSAQRVREVAEGFENTGPNFRQWE